MHCCQDDFRELVARWLEAGVKAVLQRERRMQEVLARVREAAGQVAECDAFRQRSVVQNAETQYGILEERAVWQRRAAAGEKDV